LTFGDFIFGGIYSFTLDKTRKSEENWGRKDKTGEKNGKIIA